MEISGSVVANSLRVGLQIISSHNRPLLEVYHQVRNTMGPEYEFDSSIGTSGAEIRKVKHRLQDIFIQFTMVNIGGLRAEDITMKIEGSLKRESPRESFGGLFDVTMPQFAPGQSQFLFQFYDHDLWHYPGSSNEPNGLKDDSFTITIFYNPPKNLITKITTLPWRMFGNKRYISKYTFSAQMVAGDLPPIEYTG